MRFYARTNTFLAIVVLFFAQNIASVNALNPDQRRIYDSNVGYFDLAETLASNCSAATNLVGSDEEEQVYNFLISQDFQPYQAAGIMGNMQAESHFEPRLVEYGYKNTRGEVSRQGKPSSLDDNAPPDQPSLHDGKQRGQPGYGIVQWGGGRKKALHERAAAAGVKDGDLSIQLQHLMEELRSSYKKSVYDPILAAKTLEEVSDIFMVKFENPADKSEAKKESRRKFGRDILARHGSSSGGDTTSSGQVVGCSNGNGEVVGGYSLPVDKRWYDEKPQMFSDPHHDYAASDLPIPVGTNVYSMSEGTVVSVDPKGDCGAGIIVDRDDGVRFKYCHGSDGSTLTGARAGDKVVAGQLIMHSANTGVSTGPHLHVEIKAGGQLRCPQTLFKSIVDGSPIDPNTLPTSGCTK